MRDFILKNFRRKILSLALAVIIWLTIHFVIKNEQRTHPLPSPPATTNVPVSTAQP